MMSIIRAVPIGAVLRSGSRQTPQAKCQPCSGSLTRDEIVLRLEDAGATLLALPATGHSTRMRQMRFDIVHTALEAYGWEPSRIKPATPSSTEISAMDEAFSWLQLIPEESFILRRIIGARALVHPITRRHIFPWRKLALTLGADHKSVQRWHENGVKFILTALGK